MFLYFFAVCISYIIKLAARHRLIMTHTRLDLHIRKLTPFYAATYRYR